MGLLKKLSWKFRKIKEINLADYSNEKVRLEEITIPNLEERDKLIQECEEEFKEMPMFQYWEEYNPLIKKLKRLSKLDFTAGVYCSQRIQNLKKEDEVNEYFKEQYDYFNQHLCWTKIIMHEIRDGKSSSEEDYEFV